MQTMHAGVALQYIECQVITLAPVCPHLCDYVWREVLGHSTSVFKAQWPALPPVDRDILDSKSVFVSGSVHGACPDMHPSALWSAVGSLCCSSLHCGRVVT